MKRILLIVLLIKLTFIFSGCSDTEVVEKSDLEIAVEGRLDGTMYQDVQVWRDLLFIEVAIYSSDFEKTDILLMEIKSIDENREVRYYCGRDNSGEFMGSLVPNYEHSNSSWMFIETTMCSDNVYIEVLNVDSDLGMEIVNIPLD